MLPSPQRLHVKGPFVGELEPIGVGWLLVVGGGVESTDGAGEGIIDGTLERDGTDEGRIDLVGAGVGRGVDLVGEGVGAGVLVA